jgi:hypothetical protein
MIYRPNPQYWKANGGVSCQAGQLPAAVIIERRQTAVRK